MPPLSVLAVDLGKTRCRAIVVGDHERRVVYDGIGAPGLAAARGVDEAFAAILPALSEGPSDLGRLVVGAAGAWAAPQQAVDLSRRLASEIGVPTVVASDVVMAHAGALGGEGGVLLIAGTGAAALGIDVAGARLVDGWGPDIGDLGSGSWLGREALRAVLRAAVEPSAATALTGALAPLVGPPEEILGWVGREGHLARRLATLAPATLDAAEAGDVVARRIVDDGIGLLVRSAVGASGGVGRVALHGGLTGHDWFRASLAAALTAAGLTVVPSLGDALDGAVLLASHLDLPHERFVHRAD